MTRLVLVDLVLVLMFVYLTERRSRARRGLRFGVRRGSGVQTRSGGQGDGTSVVFTAVTVLALVVVAPAGPVASVRGVANMAAVFVVMLLLQAVGGFVHNRTRGRR